MKSSVKIMYEQLDLIGGSPVKIKWCDYDYFKYPWHFHAEYEIVYIIKGTGTRFTGNNIEEFSEDDLVLFGSFVPHMYKSDEEYYRGDPNLRTHAIIIQFKEDFFNHAFNNYPEFKRIKLLLMNAKFGVSFDKEHNAEIRKRIKNLSKKTDINRLLECINILSLMSKSKYKRNLSEDHFDSQALVKTDERLVKVLAKIHQNYTQEICLEKIAKISCMNVSAFCRYFKNRTGKSAMAYINELRIGYACKLLLEGKMTISQICYECGFNNLSNFNKRFKTITKYTPTEYLSEFNNDSKSEMKILR